MNRTIENYTPGQTANATSFMAARDLESHGFFLVPLLQSGFDVLDAGCGPATISAGMAEAVFPGRVTAMDISSHALQFARRLAEGRELPNISFVAGSVYQMPFEDASFDVVFSHALLEHLSEPAEAVREFHRVTRPGGFVALCSPDWEAFEQIPGSRRLSRAIQAYRHLLERDGGNSRAGLHLPEWLVEAGFTLLCHDEWIEEYADPAIIAEHLAVQLETAGQFHHATTLREWTAGARPTFRKCWKYAVAVRADEYKLKRLVLE